LKSSAIASDADRTVKIASVVAQQFTRRILRLLRSASQRQNVTCTGAMTRSMFTIAVAFLCSSAVGEQPVVTFVSPCECQDFHGKNRLKSPRCASATKTVCPLELIVATHPQLKPARLSLSAIISQYFTNQFYPWLIGRLSARSLRRKGKSRSK